jgi:hypothetical protein
MGGLIQTKGTQRLANFLNRQRFDANSILRTRAVQNSAGTLLRDAFASALDQTPLLTISDAFIAQYATAHPATWYNNGRDALYPSTTTLIATAVAGGNQITFNNPVGGWPASIPVGVASPTITATDLADGKGGAIPVGTTVTGVAAAGGQTVVTLSNPVPNTIVNDRISFANINHRNLVRRWRYYLSLELTATNQSLIQSAIISGLFDTSVTAMVFQAIEDRNQNVLVGIEYQTTNATAGDTEDSNLVFGTKYISVALITPRTKAPDPLDPQ